MNYKSMNFTLSSIMAGIIFGAIGLWLMREGKRRGRILVALVGLTLMVYPYFTSRPITDWGIGVALCGLAYYLWDR